MQKAHICIVTDCGSDQGRYEIAVHRCFYPHSHDLSFFPTESKKTLHAGFTAAAHALPTYRYFGEMGSDEKLGMIVNAAPRSGSENGQQLRGQGRKVDGEEIYALRLKDGTWVIGPNSGWNLYFFQDEVEGSFLLTDKSGLETPFRSMEFMVPALAKVMALGDFPNIEVTPKALETPLPDEGTFIAGWDNHGNLYLYSTLDDREWVPLLGEHVTLSIRGEDVPIRLRHVEGIFAGYAGEPTLTTGSLRLMGRQAVHYIVVVDREAREMLFRSPPVGAKLEVVREETKAR